uniref:Fatty acyl-CoA reductase n=1 Tax=Timema californicum TaxID=61474 RepID=A0A7R9IVM2_TIMCA|nr:unnamed protein product [Timema californicum]
MDGSHGVTPSHLQVTSTTMENHPAPLDEPWGGVQAGERSTPIQEFYRDRSVFMTGASGFCGKILLSKLLRSCPYIGNIFILIRPKKNKSIAQRLEALLSEPGSAPAFLWRDSGKPLRKKPTLSSPDRDSKLQLPVIGGLVYRESSTLDHATTEVGSNGPEFDFRNGRKLLSSGKWGLYLSRCGLVLVDLVESKKHQDVLKKIVLVPGDISQPDMGISPEDRERLRREVSVVFHLAATLKFDENLKLALKTNVGGTQAVIELCKDMRHLKALVYVSTAYSQCPLQEIEERVYPPATDVEELTQKLDPMSLENVSKIETTIESNKEPLHSLNSYSIGVIPDGAGITNQLKDKVHAQLRMDKIHIKPTFRIIGKWPNTYTFTKALAEHVIDRYNHELPVAIFRPSMVWREPVPGWIDSLNGPTLPVLGGILGKMRCGHVDVTKLADIVPVDMVVNSLIATAWDVASAPDRARIDVLIAWDVLSAPDR